MKLTYKRLPLRTVTAPPTKVSGFLVQRPVLQHVVSLGV